MHVALVVSFTSSERIWIISENSIILYKSIFLRDGEFS